MTPLVARYTRGEDSSTGVLDEKTIDSAQSRERSGERPAFTFTAGPVPSNATFPATSRPNRPTIAHLRFLATS